jgi:hypothetical protein
MLGLTGLVAAVISPQGASAQTEGRIGVGVGVTVLSPRDGTETVVAITPITRVPPRTGWRPTIAFNWLTTEVEPGPGDLEAWQFRSRPVMLGVVYTRVWDRLAANGSFVTGPSWNRARIRANGWPAGTTADADVSLAWRIGGALNYSLAPRVGIQVFGGYLVNRPDVTFRTPLAAGGFLEDSRSFKADTPIFSVSAVYSLF